MAAPFPWHRGVPGRLWHNSGTRRCCCLLGAPAPCPWWAGGWRRGSPGVTVLGGSCAAAWGWQQPPQLLSPARTPCSLPFLSSQGEPTSDPEGHTARPCLQRGQPLPPALSIKPPGLLACSIIAISLLPSHCVQGPPVAPPGPVLPSAVLLPLHPGEAVGMGFSPPSPPQRRAGGAVLARRLLSRQASCWGGGPRPRSGMGGTSIAHGHQGLVPNRGAMPRAGHRDCLGEVHLGVQGVGLCCVSPTAHRHGWACALPTPRQL